MSCMGQMPGDDVEAPDEPRRKLRLPVESQPRFTTSRRQVAASQYLRITARLKEQLARQRRSK